MPQTLADRATILMRTPTAALESKVIGMAQMFGSIVIEDALVVSKGEAEPFKKLTIYAKREVRTDFARLVNSIVQTVGHEGGAPSVLVEVNGTAALYVQGEDYEPQVVPQEPASTVG
jgi:hypothetical protein